MGALIVAGSCFLVGCGMVVTIGRPFLLVLRSRTWQQASGTVLWTGWTVVPNLAEGMEISGYIGSEIRYSYVVADERYVGHRDGFFGRIRLDGQAPASRHRPGQRVRVWYDPTNPAVSVIQRSPTMSGVLSGLFAITWFLVSGFALLGLLLG